LSPRPQNPHLQVRDLQAVVSRSATVAQDHDTLIATGDAIERFHPDLVKVVPDHDTRGACASSRAQHSHTGAA
jgi:hypothetical protein